MGGGGVGAERGMLQARTAVKYLIFRNHDLLRQWKADLREEKE